MGHGSTFEPSGRWILRNLVWDLTAHNPKAGRSNLADASNHLISLSVGANPSAEVGSEFRRSEGTIREQ